MPLNIIKTSVEYSTENKLFFIFLILILFICNYIRDLTRFSIIISIIISVLMFGYGLQVTQNIIHGGTRLPKIMPGKIIRFGIKGFAVNLFYMMIQFFLLAIVSVQLNFPSFELEELILNFNETIRLFLKHDIVSCFIFLISGIIIVYVTSFFLEMSIARLADGGNFKDAFNFPKIKHAIDVIGWKNYTMDYTKIIFSIVILTFIARLQINIGIIDAVFGTIMNFLIFVTEFIGIGNVYKVYVNQKVK